MSSRRTLIRATASGSVSGALELDDDPRAGPPDWRGTAAGQTGWPLVAF